MNKIFTIVLLCCFGLLSAQNYKIGDIYTAPDGSKGIVYFVFPEGSGGWVVALNDVSTGAAWGDQTNVSQTSQNPSSLQALLNDTAGYAHTQTIRSYQNNNSNYAAGMVDFDNGWVLPSPAQLSMLYSQLPYISSAILGANGTLMTEGKYWTSAQRDNGNAWMIIFDEDEEYSGYFEYVSKLTTCRVRAVRTFSMDEASQNPTISYQWSTGETTQSIIVNPLQTTTYSVTVSKLGWCADTVEHTIVVGASSNEVIDQFACDSYEWNGQTYTQNGDYTFSYPMPGGCDSVVTLHLTVNHATTSIDEQTACESYTWIDGQTYTESTNTPTFTLTNAAGCDSIVTLHLTVNNTAYGTDTQVSCGPYTWIDGVTYPESTNTPTFTIPEGSVHGCDSIMTLHLTVNHGAHTAVTETTCESFEWNGETYAESGEYEQTFTAENGCDSVVTLHLTINHPQHQSITETAYDSYDWHGETFTESGEYMYSHEDENGCVQVDTLHLTVYYSSAGEFSEVVCEQYQWNDSVYTVSGDYTQAFHTVNGADSVVTLHLTVNYGTHDAFTETACDYYTWHNEEYAESGVYEFDYINADGCPSTDTLHLTINTTYHENLHVSECDEYAWNGETYAQSGEYEQTFTAANGCDSVVTLHLTINSTYHEDLHVSECDEYEWNGETYAQSGEYEQTFTAENGCDSVVTLHLTINSTYHENLHVSECDEYEWNGETYAESGEYEQTFTAQSGCDSVVTLHLTINSTYHENLHVSECDEYAWNGETYAQSGEYEQTFTAENGCDSVVTLYLTVNHPQYQSITETAYDSYTWHGETYTQSGEYVYAHDDENGCNQVDTLHLTIYYSSAGEFSEVACEQYQWNDSVYTVTGDYTQEFHDIFGADSVVTLHLTVNYGTHDAFTETACDYYTWHNEEYAESGVNLFEYVNESGCPSTDTLHLTINTTYHENLHVSECDEYAWNGETYAQSGEYEQTFTAASGCDSVVTLHLTINSTYHENLHVSECDEYVWNGETYAESGEYEQTFTAQNGCDSVVTLYLTVNHPQHQSITETAYDSYTWHGETYTQSGEYVYAHDDENGCNQVDTLHLTIYYSSAGEFSKVACEQYQWNDSVYTVTGDYTQEFHDIFGADSVVTLHLTVNYGTHDAFTETACDYYTWHNEEYAESGVNLFEYVNTNGCPSTDTLHLTVNQPTAATMQVSVLENALPFILNGESYDTEGTYTQTLTNVAGCDSILTINITVISTVLPDNIDSADCVFFPEGTEWGIAEPIVSQMAASMCASVPLVGDVDDDGQQEIVMHTSSKVLIFNADATLKTQFNITSSQQEGQLGIAKVQYGQGEYKTIIVSYSTSNKYFYAYDATGALLWQSDHPFTSHNGEQYQMPAISFADFNHDGWTEMYAGAEIYDAATGVLLCKTNGNKGYAGRTWATNYSTYQSSAADMYGDMDLELVVGNSVYDVDIQSRTDVSLNNLSSIRTLEAAEMTLADGTTIPFSDGNTFLVDVNLDGRLDVLVMNVDQSNRIVYLYVWDAESQSMICSKRIINARKFGMPQIGDIDNDGFPEICFIVGTYNNHQPGNNETIFALKYDFQNQSEEMDVLWTTSHSDFSGATSLTLFDFNQDGYSELVYRDENHLRIMNGSMHNHQTGEAVASPYDLATYACGSGTALEYPIVCDVDLDGAAEIIIGSSCVSSSHNGNLYIFKSSGEPWAPARKVWNQYMYNVTNVNEDLTIPQYQFNNATAFTDPEGVVRRPFNNFLQQATTIDQYGRPFYAVPDVVVNSENVQTAGDSAIVTVSYCNTGDNTLNAPYTITVFANAYGGDTICTVEIQESLLVDSCTQDEIWLPISVLCGFPNLESLVIAVNCAGAGIAQNGGQQPECDTTNNTAAVAVTLQADTIHLSATACNSYLWYGDTLTRSGEYTHTQTNASGCDSVEVLNLTIIPLPTLTHTPDTVIIAGTSATLWATGADILYWTDGNDSILSSGNSLTVSPTTTTTYYLGGQNLNAVLGDNVVYNGDFELGNTGFTSDYVYMANPSVLYEGEYYIGNNAHNCHPGFYNWNDHTTGSGNYLILNGAEIPNTNVWTQTVAVTPNTDYAFSTWVCSVGGTPTIPTEQARLQFSVNGVQLGNIFTAPNAYGVWSRYYEVWNSGSDTSAVITILNQNTIAGGNDFGIDDIVFSPLTECSVRDSIRVALSGYPDNVDSADCTFLPEGSEWGVQIGWSSSPIVHRSSPLVGDLDNDGHPEIVCFAESATTIYTLYITRNNAILVYDGVTKALKNTITLQSPVNTYDAAAYGLVKLPSGKGLIVVASCDFKLRAYDITADNPNVPYWVSDVNYGSVPGDWAVNIGFADVNHDGIPEVYVRDKIYNAVTGTLLASAPTGSNSGSSYCHWTQDTHWKLSSPVAADVYGDADLELILGNEIYGIDITNTQGSEGNSVYLAKQITPPGNAISDGNAQVADFNADGHPDVFISVRNTDGIYGTVYGYVWDVYNDTVSTPFIINTSMTGKSIPMIADIDNDGLLEVLIQCGVSETDSRFRTYKYNSDSMSFSLMWGFSTDEDSYSNSITSFDFNQDGLLELMISDQSTMRIVNGSGISHITRADTIPVYVLNSFSFEQNTIMQYPIIADVDADGSAEIVSVGDNRLIILKSSTSTPWAPARKVWNQYMYNVTNVNEDLTIPQHQFNNATAFTDPEGVVRRPFNNFLQQATTIDQYGRPFYAVPDVVVNSANVQTAGDSATVTVSYCNTGDNTLNAPYNVTVFANAYGGDTVCTVTMNESLPIDSCAQGAIRLPFSTLCASQSLDTLVIAVNCAGAGIAQNGGQQPECDTTNNIVAVAFSMHADTAHLTASACENYTWNGVTYEESGDFTQTFTAANGCDSIVTLHLTVNQPTAATMQVSVLENTLPFIFNGESYDTAGTYTQTLTNAAGCDSILTINITVISTVLPDNIDSADCVFFPEGTEWGIGQPLISSASAITVTTPMVGDIDDDGQQEIVIPAGSSSIVSTINIFNADATLKSQFNTVGFYIWNSVGLAKVKWEGNEDKNIVVLLGTDKRLHAYDAYGMHLWQSNVTFAPQYNENIPLPAISFADFNHDGWTEVYVGNEIYDAATGVLLCRASGNKGYSGRTWDTQNNPYHTIAADFCGDYTLELAAGNTVYTVDIQSRTNVNDNQMTVVKEVPSSAMKMEDNSSIPFTDGNTYLADINLDDRLDVLVMNVDQSSRVLYLYVWDVETQSIICSKKIGNTRKFGTPQIGDINQDGYDEICFITGTYSAHSTGSNDLIYALQYNPQNSNGALDVFWTTSHADNSACTGLTLFDFNQDGIAELVYRDRFNLRIINGSLIHHQTGAALTQPYDMAVSSCGSATGIEYPLVVDVDLDGEAEIVVGGATSETDFGHLYIFNSSGEPWAPARKVWNQYMYNVTNVNEDLTIPQYQFNNATAFTDPEGVVRRPFNNFLQQATTIDQYGRPFYAVPDVAVNSAASSQMQGDALQLSISYCNIGDNILNAPYTITVFANAYGGDTVCTVEMNESLPVDSCSNSIIRVPVGALCAAQPFDTLVIALNCAGASIAQNGGQQPECDTTNNTVAVAFFMHADTTHLTETACDSYLWYGDTLTQSGEYTHLLTNHWGCDSLVILHLSLNTTSANTLMVNIVENNLPFTLNDSSYTIPGTYYQHFTNAAGCDSTLTIGLTVYYNQTVEVDSTVCQSELPLTWNNVTFTQAGTLSDTLSTSHGADSIVVMTLNVLPSPEAVISGLVALCSDSAVTLTADSALSYLWSTGETTRTITVSLEGAYTLTVTNEYGCSATATHYLMPLTNPIISVTVPEMCAGNSYILSVGYQSDDNIHLGQGATTLSLTDTIYLPDGVYCEPFGCSYRSPLTFTAYADGDTIQTADDIYYVRLNMEHSFIGDLYINITCPNGQKADLLKYGGTGNSNCNSQIVSSSRGWSSGTNISLGNYLGEAYDYDVSSCDATAYGNEPGVGWNYCWSDNTTQGYVYAQGEGSLIYRSVNAHNGRVDSSNVASGTQFYHPDDSFSNLIGCPLNGSWYIEVQDGWSSDNGYIFGWELSLSNEMLPDVSFELDYSTADGPWVTPLSDTLFQIAPPASLSHDTTIAYTFTVYDTTGCGYDTTINITFHAISHSEIDTTVCESFTWNDSVYTQSGQYVYHLTNAAGCDSVLTLNLTVNIPTDTTINVTVLENNLPYVLNGSSYYDPGTYYQTVENVLGCDSDITINLTVYYNDTTTVDSTVCDSELPLIWNGITCDSTGVYISYQTSATGADSTVYLTLTVNHASGNTLTVNVLQNNLPYILNDSSYTISGTYYQHFTNAVGCDSTLTIELTVYYNQTVEVDSTVCQSELPLAWNNVTFTQAGTLSDTLSTSHGADSIVVMTLHVNPLPEAVISGLMALCSDSVVTLTADSALSYLWSTGETTRTITVSEEGTYTLTVTNEYGCEATVTHPVMALSNPILSVTVPEMCAGGSYTFSVGYQPSNNIHLGQGETTLSLTDTIFLPDGIYCEPFGCSYRSPLTFSAYADGDTIQSVDDIYYVRLNMEHSFIGDLYINITCPNGQKADLLKYGGTGNSTCNSQIVNSSRGWNAGSNISFGNFLGAAYDYDVVSCNATDFGNEPGVGWNYCWSNNTTQGYEYAPGEGSLIYRFTNAHDGIVDSSDVASGTQFYHPDDSFSNLIGCPLNGSWYIEVQDGWSIDNGYIFGWELSLSSEMLPDVNFELDYSTADGPWITTLSDTLFQIDPPADLTHDTTIAYTFTVYDTAGCGYDTTFYITFFAVPHTEFDTTVCGSFAWNDSVYTQSGQYVQYLTNAVGCDSVVTCQLTVSPLALTHDTLTLVESQLPYYFAPANTTFTMQSPLASNTTFTLTSSQGCDSVVEMTVYIYHNAATQVDTTICAANLPYTWHGHSYTSAGSFTATLLTTHGADSVVTYTLSVDEMTVTIPTVTHVTCFGGSNGAATATVTGGMPNFAYAWTNVSGASVSTSTSISNQPAGTYTIMVTDILGCTATATVTLNTQNDELQPGTIAEDQDVCEGEQPLPFTGTAASGGDNGAYQWQISTNGTDWTAAPGTNNTQNYTYQDIPTSGFSLRRAWVSQSCGTVYSNIIAINLWPNYSDTIVDAICMGAVYQGHGFVITADQTSEAGVYTYEQHYATAHCDSMVVLMLTVNPMLEMEFEDVVCEGEGYRDNGFNISSLETIGETELTRTLNLHTVEGCDSMVTLHLRIIDTALSIISLTPDFCENLSAELQVVTDMPDYVWSTGETSPNIFVTHSGRYYVTATSGDCSSTAFITIENCDGNQLLLPNAITPSNYDGLNDYFSIPERNLLYINLFEIWIYNRWGELVYYSNDKNFRWNGEYRGEIQYQTVYNYVIRYTDDSGKPYFVKGSVTVL